MDTLRATFDRLRRVQRKALIPFIMAGDPMLSWTAPLLLALEDAGADCIEIGVPFSDPLADGPVIQAASARALAGGVTPQQVLDTVASVRHRLTVPVVALSYWNPILQFAPAGRPAVVNGSDGARAFVQAACASGVSGIIVPDLPVEEGEGLRAAARDVGIAVICLAAPTSAPERLRLIARASQGFIYYVSVTGTTGVRRTLPSSMLHGVRELQLLTRKPVCVGFGISTAEQVRTVARVADGVIVGSALIQELSHGPRRATCARAAAFVRRLRAATL